MKRCRRCERPMHRKGGFVVLESDVIDGVGLVIIKADKLDPDAAGEHICGKRCLLGFINRRLDQLTGVENTFKGAVG